MGHPASQFDDFLNSLPQPWPLRDGERKGLFATAIWNVVSCRATVFTMRGFALALLVTFQAASVFGQIAVRCVVRDPTGALVYGATASVQPASGMTATDVARERQNWQSKTSTDGTAALSLPPGQYELCVAASGFQTNCREVSIPDEHSIAFNVTLKVNPDTNLAPSSLMDRRLRLLAGDNALNCGIVEVRQDPIPASDCAQKALSAKQPFVVRYNLQGIDSAVSVGLARDSSGHVYGVEFDSMGWTSEGLSKGARRMDGNHTIVEQCPSPVRLRKTNSRRLSCFPPDLKSKPNIMSPSFEPY